MCTSSSSLLQFAGEFSRTAFLVASIYAVYAEGNTMLDHLHPQSSLFRAWKWPAHVWRVITAHRARKRRLDKIVWMELNSSYQLLCLGDLGTKKLNSILTVLHMDLFQYNDPNISWAMKSIVPTIWTIIFEAWQRQNQSGPRCTLLHTGNGHSITTGMAEVLILGIESPIEGDLTIPTEWGWEYNPRFW